jgi:hypothetical protein
VGARPRTGLEFVASSACGFIADDIMETFGNRWSLSPSEATRAAPFDHSLSASEGL